MIVMVSGEPGMPAENELCMSLPAEEGDPDELTLPPCQQQEPPVQRQVDPVSQQQEQPVQLHVDPVSQQQEQPVQRQVDPVSRQQEQPVQRQVDPVRRTTRSTVGQHINLHHLPQSAVCREVQPNVYISLPMTELTNGTNTLFFRPWS